MKLRDAFTARSGRFKLLERGVELAGFDKGMSLLEPGCAAGEAAAHLAGLGWGRITAFDIDGAAVERARALAPGVGFVRADACALPFAGGVFDGAYSEAAFSVLPDKAGAAREYARVMRSGARFLLNDFALALGEPERGAGIPCLDGVGSMERYERVFSAAGFRTVYRREELGEYIGIAMSLARAFGVKPAEVGRHILAEFGRDGYVADFFSHARLTYCQMIFERI